MPGRRVLVVDDNLDIANLTALLLQDNGCEVEIAVDGPAALASAASFAPEVVFLDINLPGMDGFEVARRLREQHAGEQLTVVLFSGFIDQSARDKAEASGVDAVIEKQGEVDALEQTLVSFLNRAPESPSR